MIMIVDSSDCSWCCYDVSAVAVAAAAAASASFNSMTGGAVVGAKAGAGARDEAEAGSVDVGAVGVITVWSFC